MSGKAWYRHYATKFLDGVVGMPPDQIGAYIVVLDLIYARGGAIPNDTRWLSGHMGCSTRAAGALVVALIERGKLHLSDGYLSNTKAEEVLENEDEKSAKYARNGREGGRKRAENERAARNNSDLGQAGLKHIRVEEKRVEDDDGEARVRGREIHTRSLDEQVPADLPDALSIANAAARTGGIPFASPGHIATGVGLVREWLAAGADRELILQTIGEGVAASAEPRGIHSLKYFDARIRTAAAKRKALSDGHPASHHRTAEPPVDELTAAALARMAARRAGAAADPGGGLGLPGRG